MSIEKEFCSYEQSLALKELGFDELCFGWWGIEGFNTNYSKNSESWHNELTCSSPLKQQAFKWFRDEFDLYCHIEPLESRYRDDIEGFIYVINGVRQGLFCNYIEAEKECINKLIEIVKERSK